MGTELKSEFDSYTPTELRELYEKKTELFDELAGDAIRRACVGRTPEQTLRLRQMQWTIDAHLRKAKTPLERMHIMENIFYDQVYGGDGQLVKLVSACIVFVRAVNGTGRDNGKKPGIRSSKQPLYLFRRTTS